MGLGRLLSSESLPVFSPLTPVTWRGDHLRGIPAWVMCPRRVGSNTASHAGKRWPSMPNVSGSRPGKHARASTPLRRCRTAAISWTGMLADYPVARRRSSRLVLHWWGIHLWSYSTNRPLGLNPATRLSLWQTVQAARHETRAAFLITTHYIDEVADHLSNVSVLNHGSIVASGSPTAIREQYALGEVVVTVGGSITERTVNLLTDSFPDTTQDDDRIRIRSKHPNRDAAVVSSILATNAIEMTSIATRDASLEEAFLAITTTPGKEQLS